MQNTYFEDLKLFCQYPTGITGFKVFMFLIMAQRTHFTNLYDQASGPVGIYKYILTFEIA